MLGRENSTDRGPGPWKAVRWGWYGFPRRVGDRNAFGQGKVDSQSSGVAPVPGLTLLECGEGWKGWEVE